MLFLIFGQPIIDDSSLILDFTTGRILLVGGYHDTVSRGASLGKTSKFFKIDPLCGCIPTQIAGAPPPRETLGQLWQTLGITSHWRRAVRRDRVDLTAEVPDGGDEAGRR